MKLLLNLIFTPLFFFILFSLPIIQMGCNTTEPPEDEILAGRRDYEWTVDTLITNEGLSILRMWGSSPIDVWAVGSSSSAATSIWHYNGYKWSYDPSSTMFNMWGIYGFSQNDVWAANSESSIWNYDGTSWKLYGKYNLPDYDFTSISDFYGNSKNDIYGIGTAWSLNGQYKAIIIHYNGSGWKFIDIPEIRIGFSDLKIDKQNGILIIEAYDDDYQFKVFTWD